MLFYSHGYQPHEKLKRYQIKFHAAKIRGSSLLSRRLTCTALQLPYLHYHIIRANEYPFGVCRSQSAINAKNKLFQSWLYSTVTTASDASLVVGFAYFH